MFKWIVGFAAGAVLAAAAAYRLAYLPWRRQWYAAPEETERPFAGDDIVPDAEYVDTMAVTIDARPSAVWPWLLQMGYGRGGWYSYDAIDMLGKSAREIIPDLQDLQVGQLVPFAPGMGFRVDVLEPERSLVLYLDNELVDQQQRAARESASAGQPAEETAGLKAVGGLAGANMSAFRVSWAFVLEPIGDDRTRLLERFRTRTTPGPAAVVTGPLIDHGHFLMTRKQLLGIKERVEQPSTGRSLLEETEIIAAAAT